MHVCVFIIKNSIIGCKYTQNTQFDSENEITAWHDHTLKMLPLTISFRDYIGLLTLKSVHFLNGQQVVLDQSIRKRFY